MLKFILDSSVNGLCEGLFPQEFQRFMKETMNSWQLEDIYRDRAYDAIEFQYTYWAEPENFTARSQEFINVSIFWAVFICFLVKFF